MPDLAEASSSKASGRDAQWQGAACGAVLPRGDTPSSVNPKRKVVQHRSLQTTGFSCQTLAGAGGICYLPRSDGRHHPTQESQEPAQDAAGTRLPMDTSLPALGAGNPAAPQAAAQGTAGTQG